MNNRICEVLGIDYPIIQAPIGSASCPELAAAVSNAGGLGMLAVSWSDIDSIRQAIRRTKELTDRPFGINLVLEWPQQDRLKVCLDEGVTIVSTFWGDPGEITTIAHDAGAIVLHTVGSARKAKAAVEKGVDIIVGQGWEAGGHVYGSVSLHTLIPSILDQIPDTPVVAAGGIANGKGIASVFSLGASGVWMGTRFLASTEAAAHPLYKQKILEASEDDTVYTKLFDIGWPDASHRVIRNSTVRAWEKAGSPPSGKRPNEHEVIARNARGDEIVRYSDAMPLADMDGEVEALALYAGQSAGLIHEIKRAKEIVQDLISETGKALEELGKKSGWVR